MHNMKWNLGLHLVPLRHNIRAEWRQGNVLCLYSAKWIIGATKKYLIIFCRIKHNSRAGKNVCVNLVTFCAFPFLLSGWLLGEFQRKHNHSRQLWKRRNNLCVTSSDKLQWRGGLPKNKTALQIKPKLKVDRGVLHHKNCMEYFKPPVAAAFSLLLPGSLSLRVCTYTHNRATHTFVLWRDV